MIDFWGFYLSMLGCVRRHHIIITREMPIEDFQIKDELGKGSFGKVTKVVRISDREVYAMKQIKLQRLKERDKTNALNQIRFLASIQHPNVVSYREAFYDESSQNLCIVMDFANEGDLATKIQQNIKSKAKICEHSIWKVAYEVLEGLNVIHECNIIHRDVKPANVFFHNGVAQIGDFNISKYLENALFTRTQIGTPSYASPQVWKQEPYDFRTDIWSLGCILYEMATFKTPYKGENPEALHKKILAGVYDPLPPWYSKQLDKLIKKMLNKDQKKRPGCKQLLLSFPNLLQIKNEYTEILLEHKKQQFIQTIKLPINLMNLNKMLPKPKYGDSLPKSKTLKQINNEDDNKSTQIQKQKYHKIKSEKHINHGVFDKFMKSIKNIMCISQVSGQHASQKYIH